MSGSSLPTPATPFIGRDAELAEIRQCLTDPAVRLLSLVGLGGIGKTRLAIEAARSNLDAFPDGIDFVRLQPVNLPELILPTIAETLGVASSSGDELKHQLAVFLRDRSRLLILDSFEHLMTGVDVLIDLLHAAPKVRFLITSREKLNIQDEVVLHVGPLAYPEQAHVENPEGYDAVALFVSLLRRLEPNLTPTPHLLGGASLICRQVQGLPLAIELAAGWADTLSLEDVRAGDCAQFRLPGNAPA